MAPCRDSACRCRDQGNLMPGSCAFAAIEKVQRCTGLLGLTCSLLGTHIDVRANLTNDKGTSLQHCELPLSRCGIPSSTVYADRPTRASSPSNSGLSALDLIRAQTCSRTLGRTSPKPCTPYALCLASSRHYLHR